MASLKGWRRLVTWDGVLRPGGLNGLVVAHPIRTKPGQGGPTPLSQVSRQQCEGARADGTRRDSATSVTDAKIQVSYHFIRVTSERPRHDSNVRTRLRRGLHCTPLTSGNVLRGGPCGRVWGTALKPGWPGALSGRIAGERRGDLSGAQPGPGRPPGTFNPEQGALTYKKSVHGSLRRSAGPDRRWQPRLSAPDGRSPLPFRSQNRTRRRFAADGPAGWHAGHVTGGGR